MGILTPHWLPHLQALFKVTGTEADHDGDEKAQLHSSRDKPTLSHCLRVRGSPRALGGGVRAGWGSGIELDSFQEMEELGKEGREEEERWGGLSWSGSKIQGGKT